MRAGRRSGSTRVEIDDDGPMPVRFGDGVEGARPPSGDHNSARPIARAWGWPAMSRPASSPISSRVRWASPAPRNPEAADRRRRPGDRDKARDNAPLTVLTLDRAVSIRDYREFRPRLRRHRQGACTLDSERPGARRLPDRGGRGRRARAGDAATRSTICRPRSALYGDPLMPLRLVSYRDARFRLRRGQGRGGCRFRHRAARRRGAPPRGLRLRGAQLRPGRLRRRGGAPSPRPSPASRPSMWPSCIAAMRRCPRLGAAPLRRRCRWLRSRGVPLAAELLTLDAAPLVWMPCHELRRRHPVRPAARDPSHPRCRSLAAGDARVCCRRREKAELLGLEALAQPDGRRAGAPAIAPAREGGAAARSRRC